MALCKWWLIHWFFGSLIDWLIGCVDLVANCFVLFVVTSAFTLQVSDRLTLTFVMSIWKCSTAGLPPTTARQTKTLHPAYNLHRMVPKHQTSIYNTWFVQFILSSYSYHCLHGQAPGYLADHLTPASEVASRLRLRSTNRHQLIVPRCRLSTYGRWAFSIAGPTVWNSLPDEFGDPARSLDSFLRQSSLAFTSVTSALEVF